MAVGFAADVDPVACEFDYDCMCSRGEALAYGVFGLGAVGAGVGALIKPTVDARGARRARSPAPRVSGLAPRLRALPRGGVELAVAFGF